MAARIRQSRREDAGWKSKTTISVIREGAASWPTRRGLLVSFVRSKWYIYASGVLFTLAANLFQSYYPKVLGRFTDQLEQQGLTQSAVFDASMALLAIGLGYGILFGIGQFHIMYVGRYSELRPPEAVPAFHGLKRSLVLEERHRQTAQLRDERCDDGAGIDRQRLQPVDERRRAAVLLRRPSCC